ncbi:MAG TPA: hypothetical protein ENK18_12000 [Deltaproteobacteria bacterium]|nr:hypothetical protein [Deltaproteobacteria bacterium]
MLAWFVTTALAGSGPWSLSKGDLSVYGGIEAQRFTTLAPVFDGELVPVVVGGRIHNTTIKGAISLGLIDRVEIEVSVPIQRVEAALTGGGACADFPLSPCETSQGLGLVDLRTKWQLIDELGGAPISAALGARVRLGAHTQATRERITNLGEGTTDFGIYGVIGRTAGLGQGFYNGFLEVGYLHRPPNLLEPRSPHDELWSDLVFHVAPRRIVCLGPASSLFWRPGGVDFDTVDLSRSDRFASLRALNLRVGGELVLRDPEVGVALSVTVLQTVVARNNPSDTWIVSLGLSAQSSLRR